MMSKLRVPSIEDSASDHLESRRLAAEDRRCDTLTDNYHNITTLRRPCTLDRTPCEHRPLSPEVHSPPSTRQHLLVYLLTSNVFTQPKVPAV